MSSLLSGIRSQSPLSVASDNSTRRTLNDARLFETMPLDDALDDALQENVSPEARPRRATPSPDDFARRVHSYEILNQFVVGAQWRSLALAAEATIRETPPRDERTILKLWIYRILALTSLRHYTLADRELNRLEHATHFAKLAASGRAPTVVWPFELRVLRARIPALALDDHRKSIDRLSALARACQRQMLRKPDSAELNAQRLFRLNLLIVGCLVKLRDAALATDMLRRLCEPPDGADPDPQLLSAAARLYLQLGAVTEAEALFVRVERIVSKDDVLAQMNRALYAVATEKWEVARDAFTAIHRDHSERIAAANNAAICELYLGSPQAMLNSLQQLMVESPAAAGAAEVLVFNYCSGLDLHYDGAKLREAKAKKMIEVGMWAGDGFDTNSFKIH
ncbi:hypothetical protein H4R20_001220 [Coemansia guatemalensis]|uniref:Trafficking protein particle complex subunit 12 n=2 Tax=Coemansia guatemalensis TaxID=2761395 RepID=A0A9W8I2C0_9FUNG|nr:hypothetical protein H4R20_001220 [Coemansia guatemalensis]